MSFLSTALGAVGMPTAGNVKLVIGAICIAGAVAGIGGTVWHIHNLNSEIVSLQEANNTLEANNKILQANQDVIKNNQLKLAESNSSNVKTVGSLIAERASAQQIIHNLAKAAAADKETIASMNKQLTDLLNDPKNDGLVAPALRETIRSIQNSRK